MFHYGLAAYLRHARRFGPEEVFESAAGDLSIQELGCLAAHLRRLDPKWRLPHGIAHALALALARCGLRPALVRERAGVSRWTLRRLLRDNPFPPIRECHAH